MVLFKRESEKASLKLNIQRIKIMASSPITSWQIDRETLEALTLKKLKKKQRNMLLFESESSVFRSHT